jgi:hypothetical protein
VNRAGETVLQREGGGVTLARSMAAEVEDGGGGVTWDMAFDAGGQRVRSAHEPLIQKEERA